MKLTTTLTRSFLRAALITAAVGDVRYYLNGVLLELHPQVSFLVSTDGHRMTVLRHIEPTEGLTEGSVELILPAELVKLVKSHRLYDCVTLTYDTDTKEVVIVDVGQQFSGKAIDAKFPDWRRVVPHNVSGKPADFNADYLADLPRLRKELRPKGKHNVVNVHYNGQGAALLSMEDCPAYLGVLMPVKGMPDGSKVGPPDAAAFKHVPEAPAKAEPKPAKTRKAKAEPVAA